MKTCTTCARADVAEVNAALAAGALPGGEGVNAIARRFGIAKSSLLRHRDGCSAKASEVAIASPVELVPRIARDASWNGKGGPGRPCLTCSSPHRVEIEERLLRGEPWFAIAKAVPGAPSHDSIRRHARACIADMIQRTLGDRETGVVLRVADDLSEVRDASMRLLGDAQQLMHEARELHRKAGEAPHCEACGFGAEMAAEIQKETLAKVRTAGLVAEQAARILQIVGRATGEIASGATDITKHPAWGPLVRAIAEAVAECETCSRAVETALDPPAERDREAA